MKRHILVILFLIFSFCKVNAQLQYLGLQTESNVRDAQELLQNTGNYWPKTQVIDSFLYIPTSIGIYRKNLQILNDTTWQLFAFSGIPITDFVKKNDSILAITTFMNDSLILLSIDNGLSFINYTSPHFFSSEPTNRLFNIEQNSFNSNSLVITHAHYGISKSTDFGISWNNLHQSGIHFQDWFVGFHPLDTNCLYYTGEQMMFSSFIQTSLNNGLTWTLTGNIHNHATHVLTFHPTDNNLIVSGGEGLVGISNDRGLTWTYTDTIPIYITDIKYDPSNANILYATGDYHGINNMVDIYRSIDGGQNWNIFHQEFIPNSDGALELQIFDNKLFLYTMINGVYYLNLDGTNSVKDLEKGTAFNLYPNPTSDDFHCESTYLIDHLTITNIHGQILSQYYPKNKHFNVDCTSLTSGIYLVSIKSNNSIHTKKIVIQK